MSRLDSRVRKLLELREAYDLAQRQAKAAEQELTLYEEEFWSELEDLGMKSLNIDLGEPSPDYLEQRVANARAALEQAAELAPVDFATAANAAARAARELRAADLKRVYGKVRVERRERRDARVYDLDALAEWAQRTGRMEFIKPAVRKRALNEHVRTAMETKQPLPDGVDFVTKRYVSITRKRS